MKRRDFLNHTAGAAALLTGAGQLRAAARRTPFGNPDVIVVGAGLAGLNATLLLEEIGLKVLLLEGRNRVGGRLYTLDDVPGAPEAGGSGIGSMYGRMLDAAERYDVPLGPERRRTVPVPEISMLNIRGQHIRFDDWATHALNPLPEAYRDQLPWWVPYRLYAEDNPLESTVQVTDPRFADQDRSVYAYLRSRGFSEEAIRLAAGTNMSYGDHEGPHGLSALMMFHIIAFGRMRNRNITGSPFAGQGGNQRIPEGMARHVRHDLQLRAPVVGIRDGQDRAEVRLADGRTVRARWVIVTAPFSALRLCALDAPLHPQQRAAIYRLGYTNVTHLHFVPTRRFWEDDELPPSMWTDGPAARFMALRNDPANPKDITSFIAFANDRVAAHLDRLGAERASAFVLSELARLRPSTRGALRFVKYWSWQLDPFAGGAYASWRPGQLSTLARHVAQPAGRIHFAGEHTAFANRGMEAAMESGERAALAVAALS
ncbi:MAG: NAD(P)/FAD-dependent oxidoreductase [Pseudomonadota bacterium]